MIQPHSNKVGAVVFAGGVGRRMNAHGIPKQFLEINGKPIIIYTLELFDRHPDVDGIVVVCVKEWIESLKEMLKKFNITKVIGITSGGSNGQESIYKGLEELRNHYSDDSVVLIHDGVRPLILESTISDNISTVLQKGCCITCVPTTETILIKQSNDIKIPVRDNTLIARAPQSFLLGQILKTHRQARKEGNLNFIDCCSMMTFYGHKMQTILGPVENIKITTPLDFIIFKALMGNFDKTQS